jgi:hypothetical protein
VNLAPQTTLTQCPGPEAGADCLTLPNVTGVVPTFLVPSHTTTVNAGVGTFSSVPLPRLFFDFSYAFGDPDLISSFGTAATGSFTAPDISPGDWTVTPYLVGPTGKTAAQNVTAIVTMTATTSAFDPAVSSPTGDLWLGSTNATTGFTPYVVKPGQSGTIPVTIWPQGSPGAVVSGTIYLADSSLVFGNYPEGSDLAAFPYRYTIK